MAPRLCSLLLTEFGPVAINVRSEKNNTKYSSVLLLSLVLFFSERTLDKYFFFLISEVFSLFTIVNFPNEYVFKFDIIIYMLTLPCHTVCTNVQMAKN